MLEDVIKDMRDKQVREIDRMIREMPVGAILCVHDAVFHSFERGDIWTASQKAHVIKEPYDCTEQCRKTHYGPKPENVEDEHHRETPPSS